MVYRVRHIVGETLVESNRREAAKTSRRRARYLKALLGIDARMTQYARLADAEKSHVPLSSETNILRLSDAHRRFRNLLGASSTGLWGGGRVYGS